MLQILDLLVPSLGKPCRSSLDLEEVSTTTIPALLDSWKTMPKMCHNIVQAIIPHPCLPTLHNPIMLSSSLARVLKQTAW
jgi:hypothetical protein